MVILFRARSRTERRLPSFDTQKPHLVEWDNNAEQHGHSKKSGVDRRQDTETRGAITDQPGLGQIEADIDETRADDEGFPSITPRAHQKQVTRREEDDGHDEEVEVRCFRQLRRLFRKLHGLLVAGIVSDGTIIVEASAFVGHVDGKRGASKHEDQEVRHDQLGIQVHASKE
jgi:hypothetical protein